jgi:hypothetical protein
MAGTIFDQYLQPVRSIQDRMADLDAQDYRREQLAGAKQQNQLQALAMQRDAQTRAEAEQDKSLLQQYAGQAGGDQNAFIRMLRGSGRMGLMTQGDAIEKALLERQKSEAQTGEAKAKTEKAKVDADKERLGMQMKQADTVLQAVSAARDPASYQQALQWLSSQGMDISKVPQQYDPQYVAQTGQMAMTAKERADQEWKSKGYDLDIRKQGETERQNRAQIAVQMRGQNMTDARAKQGIDLQREAARIQVMETPDGVMLIDKGTGQARPAMAGGVPVQGKDKALTEGQAKAVAFAARMQSADKTIGELAAAGRSVSTPGSRTGFGVGAAVNLVNSPEGRQLDQAKRDFVNAVLRRESGAVISDAEFANADQQYFPQIGDDAATKAQKARNRAVALEGMKADVPKGYKADLDRISASGSGPSATPSATSSGFKIIGVK